MTFFDGVGESTCKLLPFKLGCAYVGSKGVTSKGKSEGATKKGTIKAKEGATWGIKNGATRRILIKGVVK